MTTTMGTALGVTSVMTNAIAPMTEPAAEGPFLVELGPIEGLPLWHQQAHPSRHAFPTLSAATAFSNAEYRRHKDRSIVVRYPDGRGWDGYTWVDD